MGALDQQAFDALVRAGCPACKAPTLEIRSFIDRAIGMMAAEPTDAGRWVHDGEKFVDGTYRIRCAACAHVVWESDICPRCNAAGGLATALDTTSKLEPWKRCPQCNELSMLAVALVPATAKWPQPKPQPLADFGDPGVHLVAFACDSCNRARAAEGCPLCGAPSPLRPRP